MIPVATEKEVKVETIGRWAARPPDGEYLHLVELASCSSGSPEECPLQGTCELHNGASPESAIRSLARGLGRERLLETTMVKQFKYIGPVAELNDRQRERQLMARRPRNSFWPQLRELAERGHLGMIHLRQLGRLLVPPHALAQGYGTMEWKAEGEWALSTELALAEVAGAAGEVRSEDW